MDKQVQKIIPDYKQIYSDILSKKFPEKKDLCKNIFLKENLSVLDVIKLNDIIYNNLIKSEKKKSQKYRSYTKRDIFRILDFQKKNNLNNKQLAIHYGLSRNTVAKWRKLFLV